MQPYLNRKVEHFVAALAFSLCNCVLPHIAYCQNGGCNQSSVLFLEIFLSVICQIGTCRELESWDHIQPLIHFTDARQRLCLWKIIHWPENKKAWESDDCKKLRCSKLFGLTSLLTIFLWSLSCRINANHSEIMWLTTTDIFLFIHTHFTNHCERFSFAVPANARFITLAMLTKVICVSQTLWLDISLSE